MQQVLVSEFNGAKVSVLYSLRHSLCLISVPDPKTAQYSINKTSDALYFDEMLDENSVTVTAETRVSWNA